MKKKLTTNEIYETGRRNGRREGHNTPSPETREMINNLKIDLAKYQQCMEDLIRKVDEGFKNNGDQHKEIVDLIEKMLAKKADVWVQTFVTYFLYIIGVGFIGTIGYIILEAIKHFE